MHLFRLPAKQSVTQTAIVDSVKKFCGHHLVPRVRNDYNVEVVDRSIIKAMGNMGILGPTITGYNCLGESYSTYGLIAKEIESVYTYEGTNDIHGLILGQYITETRAF